MDLERLNINVNGTPSAGFTGSDARFAAVGSHVGVSLPKAYIEFIRSADGGHPEVGCICPPEGDENNFFCVDWFYSFSNPDVENIDTVLDAWNEVLGPHCLPFARDGGGNQFYLDMTGTEASVWLYLHDEGGARVLLANSFEQFLAALTSNPDFI